MWEKHTQYTRSHIQQRTFSPLLIQATAKFLGQVKPNRSAGGALGRNVTGARLLWQVYSQQGKTRRAGSGICVSQGEVEEAGDVVAMLL